MTRRAMSLGALDDQIDAAYPNRDTTSDGWIADANHPSSSDHSPRNGIVHAIDVDEDNKVGDQVVGRALWDWLLEVRPAWFKYGIYEEQIVSSYPSGGVPAWTPRPYSGSNPHNHHIHISVLDDRPFSGPHFTAQEHIMASDPTWLETNGWPEWSWPIAKKYATKDTQPNMKLSDLTMVHWLVFMHRLLTRS
jgi:hypothetical protein